MRTLKRGVLASFGSGNNPRAARHAPPSARLQGIPGGVSRAWRLVGPRDRSVTIAQTRRPPPLTGAEEGGSAGSERPLLLTNERRVG